MWIESQGNDPVFPEGDRQPGAEADGPAHRGGKTGADHHACLDPGIFVQQPRPGSVPAGY